MEEDRDFMAEALEQDARRLDRLAAHYFDSAPSTAVVAMWRTGRHYETDARLTAFEVDALIEAWCKRFGCAPPSSLSSASSDAHEGGEPEHDDTMLSPAEVMRRTGLSRSTLYRMCRETPPRFPMPFKLSERRIGWRSGDVREWLADHAHNGRRRPS